MRGGGYGASETRNSLTDQAVAPGHTSRPLQIGVVAPPWFTTPPTGYGGIERVVALLAEGLHKRGHEVTLFAPGGSQSDLLSETLPRPMPEYLGSVAVETANAVTAYRDWRRFDIIHDHTIAGLAAAAMLPTPVVHTVHGVCAPDAALLYEAVGRAVELVAISGHQQTTLPKAVRSTVIYNAIDVESVRWSPEPGSYLLFVGRAAPEKGPLEAIEIARRAGLPLRVLLKVNEEPEREYFDHIRASVEGPGVEFELQASEATKQEAFAGALGTLFPVSWDEPFGLVMIESMAAGTPVIAFPRGAVPEVIAEGVSGFVRSNVEDAVRAVPALSSVDRAACREYVRTKFDASIAVEAHERLYRSLVDAHDSSK